MYTEWEYLLLDSLDKEMRKAAKGEGIKLGNKEVLTSTQQSLQGREQQTYKYVQLPYTALSETGKSQRF